MGVFIDLFKQQIEEKEQQPPPPQPLHSSHFVYFHQVNSLHHRSRSCAPFDEDPRTTPLGSMRKSSWHRSSRSSKAVPFERSRSVRFFYLGPMGGFGDESVGWIILLYFALVAKTQQTCCGFWLERVLGWLWFHLERCPIFRAPLRVHGVLPFAQRASAWRAPLLDALLL